MPVRVAVFGSSRSTTPDSFKKSAFELGNWLALKGYVCVNGGGGQGVMGAANEGTRARGGRIIGIIHQQFCVDNDEDRQIPDMIVARGSDLNERKQLLMDNSDCFVVLPGGTGTFDELWDIVSHRSLGMKNLKHKPILVVNLDGFYDGFILQLRRAFDDKLLYNQVADYMTVFKTVAEAQSWIESHEKELLSTAVVRDADSRVTSRPSSNGGQPTPLVAVAVASFLVGAVATMLVLRLRR